MACSNILNISITNQFNNDNNLKSTLLYILSYYTRINKNSKISHIIFKPSYLHFLEKKLSAIIGKHIINDFF